jgi:hypothetical protein
MAAPYLIGWFHVAAILPAFSQLGKFIIGVLLEG